MRLLLSALFFATTIGLCGAELTTVDEPEVTESNHLAVASTYKTSRRIFFRNGIKVAALVTEKSTVLNFPPKTKRVLQFLIGDDGWVEIDLDDPRLFTSHLAIETTISATADSITVTVPKRSYCEVFFKSTGKFLDGADRDKLAPDLLKQSPLHR